MTSSCRLCGQVISGPETTAVILDPDIDPREAAAMAELAEFDLLAGKVSLHISQHHADFAAEMTAVGYLAAKVYAMNLTNESSVKFRSLRQAWRRGIMLMFEATLGKIQAAGAADPGGSSSDPDPSGSKEKNDSRKFSN